LRVVSHLLILLFACCSCFSWLQSRSRARAGVVAGSDSQRVRHAAASDAWVRNAARVVIRGSRSARQPIRPMSVAQGELRPSLRAGCRSGVLARTSISARPNRGTPDLMCLVQSGASDELPLSGYALRRQSVASRKRQPELASPRSGRGGDCELSTSARDVCCGSQAVSSQWEYVLRMTSDGGHSRASSPRVTNDRISL